LPAETTTIPPQTQSVNYTKGRATKTMLDQAHEKVIKYSQVLKQTSSKLRNKSNRRVKPIVEVCGARLEALSQSQPFILKQSSSIGERSPRQTLEHSLSQTIWDDLGLSDNVEANTTKRSRETRNEVETNIEVETESTGMDDLRLSDNVEANTTERSRETRNKVETNPEVEATSIGMQVSVLINDRDNFSESIEAFVAPNSTFCRDQVVYELNNTPVNSNITYA